MLNLQQLLERVFQQPNRSSCDKAVLGRIWEAFTTWCQEQFDAKLGVKMLGMGEFCMRHDVIGSLEFWNPMFVLAEAFARAHGLHDRRPKTQTSASESVEVDMAKIAQMTTELVGEVVIRDVVEAALLDIVDRIGASCADEALGVVTIDFVFGKLICENKSLEFHFHSKPGTAGAAAASSAVDAAAPTPTPPRTPAAAPSTAAAAPPKSRGGVPEAAGLGLTGSAAPGLPKRTQPDAPLQRPQRPHVKAAAKPSIPEVLASHEQQIVNKKAEIDARREEEEAQHRDSLNRLRGEMVLEYSQQQVRRSLGKELAEQQKLQRELKAAKDAREKKVVGIDHWPFRTEEQVQAVVDATNAKQKALLDHQVREKAEKKLFTARVLRRQQEREASFAVSDAASDRVVKLGAQAATQVPPSPSPSPSLLPAPALTAAAPCPQIAVEKTLDAAYARYEGYLQKRQAVEETSDAFVHEQRYLSEQAELIKAEEQKRRMGEMKAYLDSQVREKESREALRKLSERAEAASRGPVTVLPVGIEPDPEEEEFVKYALKKTLDNQVERKARDAVDEKARALREDQTTLNALAIEMRQSRFREMQDRNEQAEMLSATWTKQKALKDMERALGKK